MPRTIRPLSDRTCDSIVLGFAGWTIVCNGCVVLGATLSQLLAAAAGAALLAAGAMLAVRSRRRDRDDRRLLLRRRSAECRPALRESNAPFAERKATNAVLAEPTATADAVPPVNQQRSASGYCLAFSGVATMAAIGLVHYGYARMAWAAMLVNFLVLGLLRRPRARGLSPAAGGRTKRRRGAWQQSARCLRWRPIARTRMIATTSMQASAPSICRTNPC